jgi:hypothetical protein
MSLQGKVKIQIAAKYNKRSASSTWNHRNNYFVARVMFARPREQQRNIAMWSDEMSAL